MSSLFNIFRRKIRLREILYEFEDLGIEFRK